ncbi:DUF3558 family protein [Saccharomonospora xinjiangensis]|uniref:DUF3558 family protein n=1 Tax=Saccharomonospora xinjiangensis TaxID=75294 RepID=UPI000A028B95|nr:DUF3558 family protein [Saccharomonospora xinjiangensis]
METLASLQMKAAISVTFSVIALAGCGHAETGSATATPESVSSPHSVEENSAEKDVPVDSMDICALLDKNEISRYGKFEGPEERSLKGNFVCSWTVPVGSVNDTEAPQVDLVLLGDKGTGDVVDLGDGVTSGRTEATGRTVTKTSGVNPVMGTPECLIAMKISERSRIDVLVGRTADPCELAGRIVEIVDSKLPRG